MNKLTEPTEPTELVQRFLASMQSRDLDAAQSCLHAEFSMTFPGAARFSTLQELIVWAKPRYLSIGKHIECCEQVAGGDGSPIVWCYGTLFGQWPDGQPFEGIRFVDRFSLRDGLLHTQQVWNDLAEVSASNGL